MCHQYIFPVFLLAFLADSAVTVRAHDQVLFDFAIALPPTRITAQNADFSQAAGNRGLKLYTRPGEGWPGITLLPEKSSWDLSENAEVRIRLKNTGTNEVTVFCRVDNPGADGTQNCLTGSNSLRPGQADTIVVPLKRTHEDKLDGKLFGMRGYPVMKGGPGTIDPANITALVLFVAKPKTTHEFEIEEIRAAGTYVPPTANVEDATPYLPMIDALGQYRHRDWPGKTKSIQDLSRKRETELSDLRQYPGPTDWDQYGGWRTGPTLKATGFFRAEKVQGKWWLVDPEGHLFFSHGIDCVRMFDQTPVEERENWFEQLPQGLDSLQRGFVLKGHYAGRSPRCLSFAAVNVARKYGADWREVSADVIHKRLRSWGLNTIGNWSDSSVFLKRLTPYTDAVGSGGAKMIEGSEGYWGKFPDVFDPSFKQSLQRSMNSKRSNSANDPWCIGYFSDNEMSWGDESSLGLAALNSPPTQEAKRVFVAGLKTKYVTIAKLNEAWGASCGTWEDLQNQPTKPDRQKAKPDLESFYTKAAEAYFRGVRDTIKSVAPNQLYLGCRFAWVNPLAAAASAKFCKVVSYNLYRRSVADFHFNGNADVPLIIGEFHFGALDRGMFHTGLVPVASQAERAKAYRDYVLGALRHPQFVGCHWFQYQDEPTTGRSYDEENYQIGFVDIADTPYAETIDASRDVGYRLYDTAGDH